MKICNENDVFDKKFQDIPWDDGSGPRTFSSWEHSDIPEGQFYLIGGQLYIWKTELSHDDWLIYTFGISRNFAEALRYAFPRGRSAFGEMDFLIIEGSPQLEPYRQQIAAKLGIQFKDRPRFSFNGGTQEGMETGSLSDEPMHFLVDKSLIVRKLQKEKPDQRTMDFIQKFLPDVLSPKI